MIEVVACADPAELARRAADLLIDRVRATPDLVMAVPAGRTPRAMYARLEATHGTKHRLFERVQVFAVDELCPPAPADGYFWRQIRKEFLSWAGIPGPRQHPFRVDEPDLEAMCRRYETAMGEAGGLDLIMLGLGVNGHLASNEPGTPFDAPTRPVELLPTTVAYILTDEVIQGRVSSRAVTLGMASIRAAREVVVLVSGAHKNAVTRAMLDGPVTPALPGSMLQEHPRCTVLASRDALERP